ncbi:MAG: TonB-dependent siderophore receptor [Sphingomonadales bacterium]
MRLSHLHVSLGLAVCCAAPSAFAQFDDESFVSGERQAYFGVFSPTEIPASVQDIGFGIQREVAALTLRDALDVSASVARTNSFGGLYDSFAVRGFGTSMEAPTGLLANGFNAGRGFGGPRDIAQIERIEVHKGPHAALLGRGELGGVINIVTRRPTFERLGEMRFSYGRFDQFRLEADYDTPLFEDKVGARFVGFFEDAGSFRTGLESQRYGFYPSVTWQAGESTTLTYELEYTRQDLPFDRGVVALGGALGAIPIETFLGEPADGPIETEAFGHQLEVQHVFSDQWSLLAGLTYRDTSLVGFSTEARSLDPDERTLSRSRNFRDFGGDYFAIRAEAAGRFEALGVSHRLLIGADFDHFDADILQRQSSGEDPFAIDILEPSWGQMPLPQLVPALQPFVDQARDEQAFGFYVQDQITLSDKIQLRLGGRFDDVSIETENRLLGTSLDQDGSRFSPQAGLVYFINPAVSVYGSYGQGFRQLGGADAAGTPFDFNTSQSAELGVKTDLFGSISVTLAGFWSDQDNVLLPDPGNPGFQTEMGEARSLGFEADVNAALPGEIYLWLSYAFTDAELSGAGPSSGEQLLNIPRHQLSLLVSKDVEFGDVYASFGTGLLYVGERVGETATDFTLPSYTTVRLFAQAEPVEGISLRLDLDNLFNEEVYTNALNSVWVEPGQPRRFRVTATFSF